jgi:hypothetical protein
MDTVTPVNPPALVTDPIDDERPGCAVPALRAEQATAKTTPQATDDAVAHLGADHDGMRIPRHENPMSPHLGQVLGNQLPNTHEQHATTPTPTKTGRQPPHRKKTFTDFAARF